MVWSIWQNPSLGSKIQYTASMTIPSMTSKGSQDVIPLVDTAKPNQASTARNMILRLITLQRMVIFFSIWLTIFVIMLFRELVSKNNDQQLEFNTSSDINQESGPLSGFKDVTNFSFSRSTHRTLRKNSFWVKDGSSSRKAVIIAAANGHVANMMLNLRCFVKQTSPRELIVFSLDENMTRISEDNQIPYVPIHRFSDDVLNSTDRPGRKLDLEDIAVFGTRRFSGVSNSKLWIVYQVLRLGYDVILTDVDIIWCKDVVSVFEQYIGKYRDIDMFIQSNSVRFNGTGQPNTGFYYTKSTATAIKMFEHLASGISEALSISRDDQTYFYERVCRKGSPPENGTGLIRKTMEDGYYQPMCQWSPDKGASISQVLYLPNEEFPNGASNPFRKKANNILKGYYREQCKTKNITMWHANYIRGTRKEKVMRDQNVWLLQDDGTCEAL